MISCNMGTCDLAVADMYVCPQAAALGMQYQDTRLSATKKDMWHTSVLFTGTGFNT